MIKFTLPHQTHIDTEQERNSAPVCLTSHNPSGRFLWLYDAFRRLVKSRNIMWPCFLCSFCHQLDLNTLLQLQLTRFLRWRWPLTSDPWSRRTRRRFYIYMFVFFSVIHLRAKSFEFKCSEQLYEDEEGEAESVLWSVKSLSCTQTAWITRFKTEV